MFLEKFGQFCFSRIRTSFFYTILIVPFFLAGGYLMIQYSTLQELEHRFLDTSQKEKFAMMRKTRKERFIERYRNSDPFFLDKQIESLSFLQKERLKIESLIHHPALVNKPGWQERLGWISGPNNRLAFIEENIRISSKIKETDEKQRYPVQLDESDLEKLFASVEDIPIGAHQSVDKSPQLIIRNCTIKKIPNLFSEVFEVDMELLKREWTEHE